MCAPLADWEKLGEYNSFQECAAGINAPHSDNEQEHQRGKLTKGELMLGFKCVQTSDERLTSPRPYNWKTDSLVEQ
jgi:hypothetical protein